MAQRRIEGSPEGRIFEGLSPDQRQSLREAFRKAQEKSRDLGSKMREARARLQDAIWAERMDESAIRDRAREVARIEAELAVVRARAFASIRPKLSPDQVERLRNLRGQVGDRLRDQLRQRFEDRERPDAGMRPMQGMRRDAQNRGDQASGDRPPMRQRLQDRRRGGSEDVPAPRDDIREERRPDGGGDRPRLRDAQRPPPRDQLRRDEDSPR